MAAGPIVDGPRSEPAGHGHEPDKRSLPIVGYPLSITAAGIDEVLSILRGPARPSPGVPDAGEFFLQAVRADKSLDGLRR
jgi:hypothetical protein